MFSHFTMMAAMVYTTLFVALAHVLVGLYTPVVPYFSCGAGWSLL